MLAFVGFIVAPLLILALLGWGRAYLIIGYFIFVLAVLFLSSVLGIGLTVLSAPSEISSYVIPNLWTAEYVDSTTGMLSLFKIPYIFLADLFRIYFDFGSSRGGFLFWIPQFIAYYTIAAPLIVYMKK